MQLNSFQIKKTTESPNTLGAKQTIETITALERHILELTKLGGHESEVAACRKAIESLNSLLPIALVF